MKKLLGLVLGLCLFLGIVPTVWAETPKYSILIIKSEYLLELKAGDKVVRSYTVGIGKNPGQKQRVGDMATPTGEDFYIEAIINSAAWTHDFKDGKGEIADAYGPWFLSIETPWDGIGIHGTHKPESVGTMDSEGCIRMYNDQVTELKDIISVGTKVVIRETREK